ncbi:hypothetical protein N1851_034455 [Merluccius polli]|uniref:Myb/SANT-like DNA-binding domain-containing protein n=1 Tax=Merluccius polli TaxID=89951 RepID=A0AA47LZJ7_MERPO|nr:hypothetical protein N1851_034455 [Merluccius polli]
MATGKRRATYFNNVEIETLMHAYGEYLHVFRKKSNTAAATKERETAWEKIASRVNACNPAGEKRTWQQLKMKYKNIVQTDCDGAICLVEEPPQATTDIVTLPVKQIYQIHLLQKIKKYDQEMLFLDRQIRKTDLEIEILEHKLEVSAWSQVNYVNYWNIN